MASIVDTLMARRGTIDPEFEGVNWARAADREWHRERGETERAFLARVRAEAAERFRVVWIGGVIAIAPPADDAPLAA